MTSVELAMVVGAGGGLVGHIARHRAMEAHGFEQRSAPGRELGLIRDLILGVGGGPRGGGRSRGPTHCARPRGGTRRSRVECPSGDRPSQGARLTIRGALAPMV